MTIPTPRERADDTAALTYPNRQSAHHNALSITIRLAIEADRRALLAEVEAVTDRFDDGTMVVGRVDDHHLAVVTHDPDVVLDLEVSPVQREDAGGDHLLDAHRTTTERSTSPRSIR